MSDIYVEQMKLIQEEYRTLLIKINGKLFEADTENILDEINVFWQRNKGIAKNLLFYGSNAFETYIFTAATKLDIDDKEHYPFLCFGKRHIWDDPLYDYFKTYFRLPQGKAKNKYKNVISKVIKDNIEILEQLNDNIFILPVRFLSDVDDEVINKTASNAFKSLFKDEIDINDFLKSAMNINDIEEKLVDGISELIIFEDLNNNLKLPEKLTRYKMNEERALPENPSDTVAFWFGTYSYFAQVIHIVLCCSQYQLVPYIRFPVTFKYLLMLMQNFIEDDDISEMVFKCIVTHVLHTCFDKNKFAKIDIQKFIKLLEEYDYESKVFNNLKEEDISIISPNFSKTIQVLQKHLELCFP